MTFEGCVAVAAANKELVAEFDRLNGSNLSRKGLAIELAVDDATGRTEDDVRKFIDFVWECIYTRLPEVEGEAS